MSFQIICPSCGPRDVTEFRHGGEIVAAGVAANQPGPQRERWFHRLGCRRWLVALRDVRTNEVSHTALLENEAEAP
jgi:sarcosine oxidase subunit delta